MRWSWKIGRLVGIDLYVHATFFLLILWVAIVYWVGGRSLAAVVNGVVFILVLFACVVAHEFGHALTARRYGIPTRDITLLPIGGISRLERMPDKPWEEFWVAVSGPAVNVALAIVLYAWILISHGWIPVTKLGIANGPFVERILMANLFLAVFNLLPAFSHGWRPRASRLTRDAHGLSASYSDSGRYRPGSRACLWAARIVFQSVSVIHRILCLDRRRAGGKRRSGERRIYRDSYSHSDANRFPDTDDKRDAG